MHNMYIYLCLLEWWYVLHINFCHIGEHCTMESWHGRPSIRTRSNFYIFHVYYIMHLSLIHI